jgi:hypothetical protein
MQDSTRAAVIVPAIPAAVVIASLLSLMLAVLIGLPLLEVSAAAGAVTIAAVGHRRLLQWHSLIGLTILVILFIPIKRYRMPGDLPFELEPYRVVVALVAACWFASLLIDPRVRLRRTGFEGPILLFAFAAIGSVLANDERIQLLGVHAKVVKELTFFMSFFLVTYLIASLVREHQKVDLLLKVLVGGGAAVAVIAIFESRTGMNLFDRLHVLPFLEPVQAVEVETRGGRFRAFGSAQHPIALGAALAMLFPLAVYLAVGLRQRRWWIAAGLLGFGALAPVSRTAVLMAMTTLIVFFWLRPRETRKAWPVLLPAVVAIHLVLPSTIGTLRASFFPKEGLIANQSQSVGSRGQGRIADLGPALDEYSQRPILGQGLGTRVVDGENPNAQILDNQWLKSLLETGAVGLFAILWLLVRSIRRLGRRAKSDDDPRTGWLCVALTASITAFAVGMLTFDAFSFIQVTFLLFILLGFASGLTTHSWAMKTSSLAERQQHQQAIRTPAAAG